MPDAMIFGVTKAGKHSVTLGLGGNLPPRGAYLQAARLQISQYVGPIVAQSSVYESEPWGFDSADWFLNQVVEVETLYDGPEVLRIVLAIEQRLGRERLGRGYASRTIDIDVLLIDDLQCSSETLHVPHPQIANRRFVLMPLLELDSHGRHPVLGISWRELLSSCRDTSIVRFANPAID